MKTLVAGMGNVLRGDDGFLLIFYFLRNIRFNIFLSETNNKMLVCKLNLDNTGATVSWLCVVHCVAMPLVVSLLPLVGLSFLADERLEWLFLSTSLLIAVLSLLPAYFRRHNKIRTLVFFALGMTLVVLARELFEDSWRYQIPLLIFGTGMITTEELVNRRLCRACFGKQNTPCE